MVVKILVFISASQDFDDFYDCLFLLHGAYQLAGFLKSLE